LEETESSEKKDQSARLGKKQSNPYGVRKALVATSHQELTGRTKELISHLAEGNKNNTTNKILDRLQRRHLHRSLRKARRNKKKHYQLLLGRTLKMSGKGRGPIFSSIL